MDIKQLLEKLEQQLTEIEQNRPLSEIEQDWNTADTKRKSLEQAEQIIKIDQKLLEKLEQIKTDQKLSETDQLLEKNERRGGLVNKALLYLSAGSGKTETAKKIISKILSKDKRLLFAVKGDFASSPLKSSSSLLSFDHSDYKTKQDKGFDHG